LNCVQLNKQPTRNKVLPPRITMYSHVFAKKMIELQQAIS
jgi:hypothetical protein